MQAKPDMTATSRMKKEQLLLNACPRVIGYVPGVQPGDVFSGKGELRVLGIHSEVRAHTHVRHALRLLHP